MTAVDDFLSSLTSETKPFFLTAVFFSEGFSVDWFPSVPSSGLMAVVLNLSNRKWVEQKKDAKGVLLWTTKFPRREILKNFSKEEQSEYCRRAVEILKQYQSDNENIISEIARQRISAGIRENDLDIILNAADLEQKRNNHREAARLYDAVLDYIDVRMSHEKSSLRDRHRRLFIQAVERRSASLFFYPQDEKLRRWFSLAETFTAQLDDKRARAALGLAIGQHYCVTMQAKKGMKYLQQAQEMIDVLGDEALHQSSRKLQFLIHLNHGEFFKAIETYEQAVGSIESFQDFFSLFAALGMSLAFTEGGMPQRGLGICYAIRNQWDVHKNDLIMSASLVMEGNILFQIRELESSRRCFEQALERLKGQNNFLYESAARVGLVCIDHVEGKVNPASFGILNKVPQKIWRQLINFFYIFEGAFTLYQNNIEKFENRNLFGFLSEIRQWQLIPRVYQLIRRLLITSPNNHSAPAKKIKQLLDLEKEVLQESVTFEHAGIWVGLARLYRQTGDTQQASIFARKVWMFLHPIATKAFPADLFDLLPHGNKFPESSLTNFIIEMGKALTKKDSLEQLLTGITSSISRMTGAERAAIFIQDHESSQLLLAASRNLVREDIRKAEFKMSLDAIRRVSQSNHSTIHALKISDTERPETRRAIIAPLILNEKNMGVLYQDSRFFHIDTDSGNSEVLAALASQIAVSIDRAKALEEIAELNAKLMEEKLYYQSEKEEFRPFGEIVGSSPLIVDVQKLVRKVAPTQSAVLIQGETGVGKELVARAIHRESPRKNQPFIRVNCAALPESLIDSELFGHEKGAFTGAVKTKAGRFELAHQGTIFLDEVSELPLPTQSRLLRVLQEKEFQRVGGTKTLHSDFRLITATNKDLRKEVEAGRFREDLFYRLNVYPIVVPPLRERREDIPQLSMHFLNLFSAMHNKHFPGITASEMKRLESYVWPGNIRELSNVVERAVISCDSKLKFPELQKAVKNHDHIFNLGGALNLKEKEKRITTKLILEALEKSGGKVGGKDGAAELLGINRPALMVRMKRLGIKIERKPASGVKL